MHEQQSSERRLYKQSNLGLEVPLAWFDRRLGKFFYVSSYFVDVRERYGIIIADADPSDAPVALQPL